MSIYAEVKQYKLEIDGETHLFEFREPSLLEMKELFEAFTTDPRVVKMGGIQKFLKYLDDLKKSGVDMEDGESIGEALGEDGDMMSIGFEFIMTLRNVAAKCIVKAPDQFDDPVVFFKKLSERVKTMLATGFQELFPMGEYMNALQNSPNSTT